MYVAKIMYAWYMFDKCLIYADNNAKVSKECLHKF